MSLDYRNERWDKKFNKMDSDFDNLVEWWEKNKPCECDSEETGIFCKHFDKILVKLLGKRVDELWNERLQIGFETMNQAIKN